MNNRPIIEKIINRDVKILDDLSKEELAELVRNVSTTDNLTMISNERGLFAFMKEIEANGTVGQYDTYFCNIRSMRVLNNRWTDVGGSQIIVGVARTMADFVEGNGIVARMGGDNFFVFLKKEYRNDFIALMEELVVRIVLDDTAYHARVGTRMGMYSNQEGDTVRWCLDAASMALQHIRVSSDKFCIEFQKDMQQRDLRVKGIKDDLRQGIEDKEFEIFYQPKIRLSTKEICGAEALSRWNRKGEIILPSEFVPVIENNGAVCHLDFYVFEQVCKNIKEWQRAGIEPVRISSNFSKKHLGNANFAEEILQTLDRYEVDYSLVEIELTEASDAEDSRTLKEFLNIMNCKGIRTSIDDFGSGYSSLKLLKEMKMSTVKLDKSLIDDTGIGIRENDAITSNLISMLNDLGMEVVAEGVEYSEQICFLKKSGCDIVQGFYFDRPLREQEFTERLKTRRYI